MTTLRRCYEANARGCDYVVGDIHGQFGLLQALFRSIGFDKHLDRLFSVGDLIDRGPESHRVTEFLAAEWFHAILGNHEVMLINSADAITQGRGGDGVIDLWRANGGDWFFELATPVRQAVIAAIRRLPVTAEISLVDGGRAGLVHAGMGPHWSELAHRSRQMPELDNLAYAADLVWSRELAYAALERVSGHANLDVGIEDIDVVFFGHTPMAAPIRVDNTRWLDTGAGFGAMLSVAELAV